MGRPFGRQQRIARPRPSQAHASILLTAGVLPKPFKACRLAAIAEGRALVIPSEREALEAAFEARFFGTDDEEGEGESDENR